MEAFDRDRRVVAAGENRVARVLEAAQEPSVAAAKVLTVVAAELVAVRHRVAQAPEHSGARSLV